nr:helicase-primase complex component [Bovine gammaherpesvirus 4]
MEPHERSVVFRDVSSTTILTTDFKLLISAQGSCHQECDLLSVTSFVDSMTKCISFIQCKKCNLTPEDIIEVMLGLYYVHRSDTQFWLLPRDYVTQKVHRPVYPTDCLAPQKFLLTTNGPMCWLPTQPIPSNIHFNAYLNFILQILYRAIGKVYTTNVETEKKLNGFVKILNLF